MRTEQEIKAEYYTSMIDLAEKNGDLHLIADIARRGILEVHAATNGAGRPAKRRLSPEALERISEAQRKRWRRAREEKEQEEEEKPRRPMTAAGRKRMLYHMEKMRAALRKKRRAEGKR